MAAPPTITSVTLPPNSSIIFLRMTLPRMLPMTGHLTYFTTLFPENLGSIFFFTIFSTISGTTNKIEGCTSINAFLSMTGEGFLVNILTLLVFYAGPNGALCALLDRIFYAGSATLRFKPAAAVVSARRGGTTATFDRLIKYFT